MSTTRLANALGEKFWEDGDVQDIASVDEGACGRIRELCKARDGLLRGDKGTVDVDGRVAAEVGKGEREGVVGGCEGRGADCDASIGRQRQRGDKDIPL